MKSASAQLITLLNSGAVFLMADLYTITLLSGTILRWSQADTDLTLGANTFLAATDNGTSVPLIRRGEIRLARGLEVSTFDVTLLCGQTVLISGIPMPLFAHNGGFDGARLRVERVFMPTWGDTSPGSVVLFEGAVAGVDPSTTQVVLHIKSDLEKLQRPMPRTLFAPGCPNSFGDTACGINVATLTQTGTVGASPSTTSLPGAPAHADGYYTMGVVTMTSGVCAGAMRAVRLHASNVLTLATPLPATPAAGDTYTISPRCNGTQASCTSFGNAGRFRGCPYVPPPETTR